MGNISGYLGYPYVELVKKEPNKLMVSTIFMIDDNFGCHLLMDEAHAHFILTEIESASL